jgi:[acyl-carrier-protein] S-malonyltransferase
MLLLGQGGTIEHFQNAMSKVVPGQLYLRLNPGKWPPLHTPIMWQKCIPDRSARLMQSKRFQFAAPTPEILSLVTGKFSYGPTNGLDLLHRWVDHPQRLWEAIYQSLQAGIETYLHVGPEPNIIPATLNRLQSNIRGQTKNHFGIRALTAAVRRSWLQSILPERTSLLRAANIRQINLEDWLLEQMPPESP